MYLVLKFCGSSKVKFVDADGPRNFLSDWIYKSQTSGGRDFDIGTSFYVLVYDFGLRYGGQHRDEFRQQIFIQFYWVCWVVQKIHKSDFGVSVQIYVIQSRVWHCNVASIVVIDGD